MAATLKGLLLLRDTQKIFVNVGSQKEYYATQ